MRVLITGAGGMLGQDLLRTFCHQDVTGVDRSKLDITDLRAVRHWVRSVQPEVVINAAAFTNVDACEATPDRAFAVNAVGAQNLAIAAQEMGVAIVQFSTDYVFSGISARPYREYDTTGPLSVYGQSKLAGERLVAQLCRRHYIVRTAWLYGRGGKNFVRTMLELGSTRDFVQVVNDQIGSPTYTMDLAQGIESLVSTTAYGTYHVTNGGSCSWYQFAQEIFAYAQMPTHVEAISTAELKRAAPRPAYSVLDNQLWRLQGLGPLRPYENALKAYMQSGMAGAGGTT